MGSDHDNERFYEELPAFEDFVEVSDARHYQPLPDSWLVVITDVRGSTKAIEAGRYKDVNSLGVASIVALHNAVAGLKVPYVFGGDGATVLMPSSRREAIESALRGIREMSKRAFDLEMRTGIVPMSELREAGFEISVARFLASNHVQFAMMSGPGVTEADRRIKDPEGGARYAVTDEGEVGADFTGFECRWRPIPSRRGKVVSLLVQAKGEDRPATYRRIIEAIEGLLAEAAPGRPVDPETLKLQSFGDPFDQEARIRSGSAKGLLYRLRLFVAKMSAVIGTFLMNKKVNALGFPGRVYQEEVVANTDFRKFDDMLRMVLDVSDEQRTEIEALLSAEHQAGHVVYGVHEAPTSIMTCAISDYHGEHVHFVDGANGGYALAAKQLKGQLKAAPND